MNLKNTEILKYFIVGFVGILIMVSCKSKEQDIETIKIDPYETEMDNTIDAVLKSVVKLETNDSTLIGDIWQLDYFEDKIYILDIWYSKSLFVFEKDGRFISRTHVGKGLGEVVNPFAFYIDKENRRVMLWDQILSSMTTYNLNLDYIDQ